MRSTDIPQLHPHLRFQWEPAQDAYVLLYPRGDGEAQWFGGGDPGGLRR